MNRCGKWDTRPDGGVSVNGWGWRGAKRKGDTKVGSGGGCWYACTRGAHGKQRLYIHAAGTCLAPVWVMERI